MILVNKFYPPKTKYVLDWVPNLRLGRGNFRITKVWCKLWKKSNTLVVWERTFIIGFKMTYRITGRAQEVESSLSF